jgi:hypothetical protein
MQERYMSARNTSSLVLSSRTVGSADVMIAAGRVAKRSERKAMALAVWGVLTTENMRGANAVADVMARWIREHAYQMGERIKPPMPMAFDVAMAVLKWWRAPACLTCGGHGHPNILNSPVIDELRDCPDCRGTGRIPLERLVRSEYVAHAHWLSGEIDTLCALVFGEMARELNDSMDLL